MIDFNDEKYLNKLKAAVSSPHGRLILEYFRQELKKLDYDNIDTNGMTIEEIGRTFKVYQETHKYINKVLSILDETVK